MGKWGEKKRGGEEWENQPKKSQKIGVRKGNFGEKLGKWRGGVKSSPKIGKNDPKKVEKLF